MLLFAMVFSYTWNIAYADAGIVEQNYYEVLTSSDVVMAREGGVTIEPAQYMAEDSIGVELLPAHQSHDYGDSALF